MSSLRKIWRNYLVLSEAQTECLKHCFKWGREESNIHHKVYTLILIHSSQGKVTRPSQNSISLISHESVEPGVYGWLDLRAWDDVTFIYPRSEPGQHGLMDDSVLFCFARRLAAPAVDVPGRALVWRTLLAFCYQSAGISPDCTLQQWHPCTPTMSASSLATTCCIMTASVRLMSLKGSNVCLILKAAFMEGNNGVCLNSSVFFFHSEKEKSFSSRYSQSHVAAIWWLNA